MRKLTEVLGEYREGSYHHYILGRLLSNSPDAIAIRKWCKGKWLIKRCDRYRAVAELWGHPNSVYGFEDWEAVLMVIFIGCREHKPLERYEVMSSDEKRKFVTRVQSLAKELVEVIEASGLGIPLSLDYLSDKSAIELASALMGGYWVPIRKTDRGILFEKSYEDFYGDSEYNAMRAGNYLDMVSREAFRHPPLLTDALREFSKQIEGYNRLSSRDSRPNTGIPEARVFARHMCSHNTMWFEKPAYNLIGSLVSLFFPTLDAPANEDTIRKWVGKK